MSVAAESEAPIRTGPTCTIHEAVIFLRRVSYSKLRRLAVDKGQFTVVRDADGKGNPISLRWDELDVYVEGGLPALRRFRVKKGRAK